MFGTSSARLFFAKGGVVYSPVCFFKVRYSPFSLAFIDNQMLPAQGRIRGIDYSPAAGAIVSDPLRG